MRILFNTYPVAFDCIGGGEIQLLKTKEALEALGVVVSLFDTWDPQLDRHDLVHFFSVQGGSINFCSHVKRKGLPLVISPVLWLGEEKEAYPLGEIRDLLHLADRALPNSHAELRLLADSFGLPATHFSVVPNGVDPDFARPVSPQVFRSACDLRGPFLLNVANIEPRKNQLTLIRAMKSLDVPLVLLGNVRDDEYFRQCLREGENLVRYLGYLENGSDLLVSAYKACEALVLPSLLETPGLAALEAAAAGARIVITEVGSTREYFGEYATYVNPHDERDINRGIAAELAACRDEALRRRILSRYTWTHAARQTMAVYETLIRKNSQGSTAGV
jgi:glycosyltransferase involved in cell wall biosynthesis